MSSIYYWFFSPSYPLSSAPNPPIEEIPIQVLQLTDFDGVTSSACILKQSTIGKYFLHPQGSEKQLFPDQLPSIDPWPSACTTEEEYQRKIESFNGLTSYRPSAIANLLSDLALNVPHPTLCLKDKEGNSHPLSNQMLLDLCRRSLIYVNRTPIFQSSPRFPPAIPDKTDAENAQRIVELCLEQLGDAALTNHALKLATQATLAHLCVCVMTYFTNPTLQRFLFCTNQILYIDSDALLTTITYESYWKLVDIKEIKSPNFLKAEVRILIESNALRQGKAEDALLMERISPFYQEASTARQSTLNQAGWPSALSTQEKYVNALKTQTAATEEIPTILIKSLIKRQVASEMPTALETFDNFSAMTFLRFNGASIFSANEEFSLNEQCAEKIITSIASHSKLSKIEIKNILALGGKEMYEFTFLTYLSRYAAIGWGAHLRNVEYNLEIQINGEGLMVQLESIWSLNDPTEEHAFTPLYFKGVMTAHFPLYALTQAEQFDVSATLYTSKFFEAKSDAQQADALFDSFEVISTTPE